MDSHRMCQAFDPNHGLPDAFCALPSIVYNTDEFWLGENTELLKQQFSHHNTWFLNGAAWIGVVPGKARLAGFFNQQEIDGEASAFFGYWEGIDDITAHDYLFQELRKWAITKGAKRVYGPINFTTFNTYRLRLDQFEQGCFLGEPWNPPHYPSLMEKLGFECRYRYLSTFNQTTDIIASVADDYLKVKPKLSEVVQMEAMTPEFWLSNLDNIYGFVDEVFGSNFAYTPISRASFGMACGEHFANRFCPTTSVLARSHDGRIAGFFLVFPDYSSLLTHRNPSPISSQDLAYQRHFTALPYPRRGLAKTAGVHPDFRSLGLFTAMSCELSLRSEGIYDELGAALVRADNNSRQFALRHGLASQRQYGLFQKRL